jgi:hypothetical protein
MRLNIGFRNDDVIKQTIVCFDHLAGTIKHRRVFHFFAFAGALLGLPAFMAAVRAVLKAMAIACFCGLPDFISRLMLEEMVLAL